MKGQIAETQGLKVVGVTREAGDRGEGLEKCQEMVCHNHPIEFPLEPPLVQLGGHRSEF